MLRQKKNRTDRSRREEKKREREREGEQQLWFVMRSPQQHVPASSTKPRHILMSRGCKLFPSGRDRKKKKKRFLLQINCRMKRIVFIAAAVSTGSVSTLLHQVENYSTHSQTVSHRSQVFLFFIFLCFCICFFFCYSGEVMETWAEGQETDLEVSKPGNVISGCFQSKQNQIQVFSPVQVSVWLSTDLHQNPNRHESSGSVLQTPPGAGD